MCLSPAAIRRSVLLPSEHTHTVLVVLDTVKTPSVLLFSTRTVARDKPANILYVFGALSRRLALLLPLHYYFHGHRSSRAHSKPGCRSVYTAVFLMRTDLQNISCALCFVLDFAPVGAFNIFSRPSVTDQPL